MEHKVCYIYFFFFIGRWRVVRKHMIWGLKTLRVSEKGIVIIFIPYYKGHLGITPPTVLKKISA